MISQAEADYRKQGQSSTTANINNLFNVSNQLNSSNYSQQYPQQTIQYAQSQQSVPSQNIPNHQFDTLSNTSSRSSPLVNNSMLMSNNNQPNNFQSYSEVPNNVMVNNQLLNSGMMNNLNPNHIQQHQMNHSMMNTSAFQSVGNQNVNQPVMSSQSMNSSQNPMNNGQYISNNNMVVQQAFDSQYSQPSVDSRSTYSSQSLPSVNNNLNGQPSMAPQDELAGTVPSMNGASTQIPPNEMNEKLNQMITSLEKEVSDLRLNNTNLKKTYEDQCKILELITMKLHQKSNAQQQQPVQSYMNQSMMNQSMNPSMNQSTNQSMNTSMNQPINQPSISQNMQSSYYGGQPQTQMYQNNNNFISQHGQPSQYGAQVNASQQSYDYGANTGYAQQYQSGYHNQ